MKRIFTPPVEESRALVKFFCCCLLLNIGMFSLGFSQDNAAIGKAMQYLQAQATASGNWTAAPPELIVTDAYQSKHNKIHHVYFRQGYAGIPIYQTQGQIHMRADLEVVRAHTPWITAPAGRVNSTTPSLQHRSAIAAAARHLGLPSPSGITELSAATGSVQAARYSGGNISSSEINVQLMYHLLENGDLRLCWDLAIELTDGSHWWSMRVDAETGDVLDQNDWMSSCNFEEGYLSREHDHPLPEMPAPLALYAPLPPPSNSYRVYAEPVESPNHGVRTLQTTTGNPLASPFGWHDTNGVPGAEFTITRGNNVHAQEDQNGNNGNGYSPDGGVSLEFDYPIDFTQAPSVNVDAALTNLFYWNNYIHDVMYQYGFDEPSGNFQEDNYGRGGNGGDYVRADGLDGSGFNNANFGTPGDGANPRMQMFLWAGQTVVFFDVNSPPSIAGPYSAVEAAFGPGLSTVPLTGNLVEANDGSGSPSEACNALTNATAMNGNIALIDRGNCSFINKVQNAENAGAIACVVCNNVAGAPIAMGGAGGPVNIPSVMISQSDCAMIRAQLASGVNVSMSNSGGAVDRDGDYDNGIIVHEYGHGISNRLVAGPSNTGCLNSTEQMGEGWSDFYALMTTIETGDAGPDRRGIGTYAIFQPTNGDGIRPSPYSNDLSVNPWTYGNLGDGAITVPHGVGFVWCSMLWDMNWALIDAVGYDPDIYNGTGGNNIAMQLVTDGLKLTPCNPGFVDGRDAILLADTLNYGGAYSCIIWEAFARRGLGLNADQGSSNSRTDGTEDFTIPTCTPLPVTWANVSATPMNDHIRVDWETVMERDNTGFGVERRAAGEPEFTELGFVNANQRNNGGGQYAWPDQDVRRNVVYEYRIRQVDQDGRSSYSKTVLASLDGNLNPVVLVYPNPNDGRFNLRLDNGSQSNAHISIYNSMGQQVFARTLDGTTLKEGMSLELENLPAGHYLIQVAQDGHVSTQKIYLN